MLSEPFAFACAGWIGGTILIIGYGLVSCYTYVFLVVFFRTALMTVMAGQKSSLESSSTIPEYGLMPTSAAKRSALGLCL